MLSARLATPGDMTAIQAITDAAYTPYIGMLGQKPLPMTEDYLPIIVAGGVWMVARDGAEVAVLVLEPEPDHMLIFSLAVLPAAQGGGIGRWMLRLAEDQARARGLMEMRLFTNARMTRNIGIYTAFGYIEQGRRALPDRVDWIMVDMAKPLAARISP